MRSWRKIWSGVACLSTARTGAAPEQLPAARGRSPKVFLPVDPTDEELARERSLSEAEKVEVLRCRGDENRRRFALPLCVLRKYGRVLVT